MANHNTTTCASYSTFGPEQLSYVVNGIVTLVLAIVATGLNGLLIVQYYNLPLSERRKNSNYLILNQAIADLFNVLFSSPLFAVGSIVYLTNILETIFDKREASCPYWYIICSWAIIVSLVSSLLLFILTSLDRALAVWVPIYWYLNLRCNHTRYIYVVIVIWIISALFALGEVYGHGVEFFSRDRSKVHATSYHHVRTVVCLLLTAILVTIWSLTFFKTFCYVIQSKKQQHSNSSNPPEFIVDKESAVFSPLATVSRSPGSTYAQPKASATHIRRIESIQTTSVASSALTLKILNVDLKLIRIFASMLLFFLLGYVPYIMYMVVRQIFTGSLSTIEDVRFHIIQATGGTALVLASCLNPILVLARMDDFKFRCLKRTFIVPKIPCNDLHISAVHSLVPSPGA